MKEKILNLLNKNSESVNQAALFLAFFAFLAQILGLVRDRLLASEIGPSLTLDIYYAAFKIPDLIFISVASLASVVVLLPILAEKIKVPDEAKRFFDNAFSAFGGLLVLACVVVFFAMPALVKLIVPGFSSEATEATVKLSRLMLFSPLFLGFSTIFGSVTQLFKKFFLFALLPVLYNFGILFGVVVFYPIFGLEGLAFGVILGALLHFVVQLPTVSSLGFLPKLVGLINWREIKKVILVSLPRTAGLALGNITLIILLALASKMAPGSISLFTFALHLQAVPITLVGVSYSMAAFPTLSLLAGEKEKFLQELTMAGRQIIFWSIPAMVLFIVLRAQIVRVILGAGRFDWDATRLVAAALALFALSIAAQGLILLFTRAFYANRRTFRPFIINLFSAVVTIGLAFVFIGIFKENGVRVFFEALFRVRHLPETTLLALPLAFSIGSILNCFLLWKMFRRDFGLPSLGLYRTLGQSLLASLVLGFMTYFFLTVFGRIFNLNTFVGIFSQGLLAGLVGIAAGIGVLYLLGNEELKGIAKTLRLRVWKGKVVISEETN